MGSYDSEANVKEIEYAAETHANPPPVPNSNPDDDFFRDFRRNVPLKLQYLLQDSGILRTIMNSLGLLGVPAFVNEYPSALYDFIALAGNKDIASLLPQKYKSQTQLNVDFNVTYKSYGEEKSQFYSLIRQQSIVNDKNHLVVFFHGGAWGSGWPGMYQLMATPFLNNGYDFSVVGYRTYPTANYIEQIDDLSLALRSIRQVVPSNTRDITLIAHSSGAHVASMGFINGQISKGIVDQFVSLAGIFDIPSHYKFERGRGVERISPMAAACGPPGQRLQDGNMDRLSGERIGGFNKYLKV